MLRILPITILILAGVVMVGLLMLRLAVSMLYALSGIRRRPSGEQVLSW
jgi:hypothetical protein